MSKQNFGYLDARVWRHLLQTIQQTWKNYNTVVVTEI